MSVAMVPVVRRYWFDYDNRMPPQNFENHFCLSKQWWLYQRTTFLSLWQEANLRKRDSATSLTLVSSSYLCACSHVLWCEGEWKNRNLVDPASSIRLSQRLSHACLSINNSIQWNCEWLIISVIVYLIVPYYLDNRSNSRANTCAKSRLLYRGKDVFIRSNQPGFGRVPGES